MKKIILLAGLPACGKSTFARRLETEPHAAIVICPDEFRKVITGQDFFRPAEEFVWATVKATVRTILTYRDKFVCVDATNLTVGSRKQWVDIAKELEIPIDIMWFDTPIEVCLERNEKRERKVPVSIIENMEKSKVKPTYEEGFTNIWDKEEICPEDYPTDHCGLDNT